MGTVRWLIGLRSHTSRSLAGTPSSSYGALPVRWVYVAHLECGFFFSSPCRSWSCRSSQKYLCVFGDIVGGGRCTGRVGRRTPPGPGSSGCKLMSTGGWLTGAGVLLVPKTLISSNKALTRRTCAMDSVPPMCRLGKPLALASSSEQLTPKAMSSNDVGLSGNGLLSCRSMLLPTIASARCA